MVVLVLNVYSRNSLAILKALEDQVTLVGGAVRNVGGLSPGAARWLKYPALSAVFRHVDPLADFDGFCADVIRACAEYSADAVMASGTTITNALSRAKPRIQQEAGVAVCVEGFGTLERLTDKWLTYELATEQGVPIPATILLDSQAALAQAAEMPMPMVVKPRNSFAAVGVRFVESADRLWALFDPGQGAAPLDGTLMAQERLQGELHDVTTCACDGEPTAMLTQHRRQALYDFGGGGIVNITTREPDLADHARRMLAAVRWNGPAMFDFVRLGDGSCRLLECNPKIWGTTWLTVLAGLNVPAQMLDIFLRGQRPEPVLDYPVGLEYRWLFPECLYHWTRPPRRPARILYRVRRTFDSRQATAVRWNLRLRDIPHIAGLLLDRAEL